MSETLGARTHSSEIACLTEVQGCDVYILILGSSYGYVPDGDSRSVTHAEYHAAKASNKPILVFLQNVKMEAAQQSFKQEVEDYQSGEFREGFSEPEELKDGIVRALSTWQRSVHAMPSEEFGEIVGDALQEIEDVYRHGYEPRIVLAYLSQPAICEDLVVVEADLDRRFARLCSAGFALLRDGYEPSRGRVWTGLTTKYLSYAVYDNGLLLLTFSPRRDREATLGYFIPPDWLRNAACAFYDFLPVSSGFFALRLLKMDQAFVAEDPGGSSLQMRASFGNDDGYETAEFFNPMSRGAFETWINRTVNAIEHVYTYPPRYL